jgi:hypothetical protein
MLGKNPLPVKTYDTTAIIKRQIGKRARREFTDWKLTNLTGATPGAGDGNVHLSMTLKPGNRLGGPGRSRSVPLRC